MEEVRFHGQKAAQEGERSRRHRRDAPAPAGERPRRVPELQEVPLAQLPAPQTPAPIDEFAEPGIMIGGPPIGAPADYLPAATVKPSRGFLSMRAMLAEARATLDVVIAEMHEDAEKATEAGDIGTADLYTRLVQEHQKNRWFLDEILKK